MGIFNRFMHNSMKKEAKRLAQIMETKYVQAKKNFPNDPEPFVIRNIAFNEERLQQLPEKSKNGIITCCKTINGLCYMTALDTGKFKGFINFRSLQFTAYMDKELLAVGFPKQSYKQKKEILEIMELAIDGWEKITGDQPD